MVLMEKVYILKSGLGGVGGNGNEDYILRQTF